MPSKKICHIFNPDHDLALADGSKHYMPPAAIDKMTTDLSILPFWFAGDDEFVIASSAHNSSYIDCCKEMFSRTVNLLTPCELNEVESPEFKPWGWDSSLVKKLSDYGANDATLPTQLEIDVLTDLSHRKHAVELLRQLPKRTVYCGESYYLTNIDQCRNFVLSHDNVVLKAPLSGSGKGLNWCKGEFTTLIEKWCKRLINKQGGVVGEPKYDKVLDFAMEFCMDTEGKLSFVGFSLFHTSLSGAYESNLLASQSRLVDRLQEYVSSADLQQLLIDLTDALRAVYTHKYVGYLGVDMMICKCTSTSKYTIHPCVEINLRMNMGVVACKLFENIILPSSVGSYSIKFFNDSAAANEYHQKMIELYPLKIQNNRILSGYLSLAPVIKSTHYIATLLIESEYSHCHSGQ